MAKNWTVAEGFKALMDNDILARQDIAKRFPLFATATSREILMALDDLTIRKVESMLRKYHSAQWDFADEVDDEEEKVTKVVEKTEGTNEPVKRKRGRPKKVVEPVEEVEEETEDVIEEKIVKPKKKTAKKTKKKIKPEPVDDDDLDDIFDDEEEDNVLDDSSNFIPDDDFDDLFEDEEEE